MSVWLCLPSKRSEDIVKPLLRMWKQRGYSVALWLDDCSETSFRRAGAADYILEGTYAGYAASVNALAMDVLKRDRQAQWIICAGDDTEPDLVHSANEIEWECNRHFMNLWHERPDCPSTGAIQNMTFGVMQPTGDRWGEHRNTHPFTPRAGGKPELQVCSQCGRTKDNSIHQQGALIDRVAGSPWMGREWCLRANQGMGPLYHGFKHMFVDQCLRDVAVMLGVYWERRDLNQLHKHWGRSPGAEIPEHLKQWNTKEHWDESEALYERLKADGFRECLPIGT